VGGPWISPLRRGLAAAPYFTVFVAFLFEAAVPAAMPSLRPFSEFIVFAVLSLSVECADLQTALKQKGWSDGGDRGTGFMAGRR